MQTILNTLYLTSSPSYVHLDNDTLRIEVERETKMRVPLHHISSVVCFGHILVSPAAMWALADSGKSLVMLDQNGRFKARLEGHTSGNVLLRTAQHMASLDEGICLSIAKACIAGKIKNSRQVLMRGAREADTEPDCAALTTLAERLANRLRRLEQADHIEVARGIEGEAARLYFEGLPRVVKPRYRPTFQMSGRSRRPPLDRFNALISYLYALLMNDCRSALESVGLDPQVGFLHVRRPGRAALALDLMEEFRAPLVDRLALTLINRGQLNAQDFRVEAAGGVFLERDSQKQVIIAYQERKRETIQHPLLESTMPLGLVPQLQARLLARVLRGEASGYLPFTHK